MQSREFVEALELLAEVHSWSNEAVEDLPLFYQRKAREYRQLPQPGEE